MKRALLFLIFLWSLNFQLNAQNLDFGIKGGLNYSWLTGDTNENFGPRISYHAGVFADFPMRGNWSFHPELLYSRQGSKFKTYIPSFDPDGPIGESVDFVFGFDYLQLPLLLKVEFLDTFSLDFGPQVGIQVNSGSELDFGPTFGGTLNLNERMHLQLRYYFGISDLFRKTTIGGSTFNDDFFDSVIHLSLGYVVF